MFNFSNLEDRPDLDDKTNKKGSPKLKKETPKTFDLVEFAASGAKAYAYKSDIEKQSKKTKKLQR